MERLVLNHLLVAVKIILLEHFQLLEEENKIMQSEMIHVYWVVCLMELLVIQVV